MMDNMDLIAIQLMDNNAILTKENFVIKMDLCVHMILICIQLI